MIRQISDRLIDSLPALKAGELRIVSHFAKADDFTVSDAIGATAFSERHVRKCLERLTTDGFVRKITEGRSGHPTRYRVCLVEEEAPMAS